MAAADAMPYIEKAFLWDAVYCKMDDDIRRLLNDTIAPCSKLTFLQAYLKKAKNNLII